ncbi:protocatechuate 3,4-dioxygenase subunit alpha [Actinoallomurus soli]|uniref:protocatechuate 3,4-dioxygenase subunit alpha n=1 Tax=Actinoallomurus soli TaxID=2952535 RepID=UPI002093C1E5|nr:protocatechuate 3,4-dioxygenase subunit alpha [Actinoallomurus soli]MCO5969713.1 protocatechuate 3,4-dioxygenase subunit alpha [Actinoallomurus soli]
MTERHMTTPSQTVGPFFGYALPYADGPYVVPEWHPDAIRIRGRVLDGAGEPLPDALVEIWQADADGNVARGGGALRRAGKDFSGFGRCGTDAAGNYWFSTLKPGGPAPHIAVLVFARGLLKPVATRIYFPGEPGNATDPVLSAVPDDRRDTLVAVREGERSYRFDVHLRGERETVFFERYFG